MKYQTFYALLKYYFKNLQARNELISPADKNVERKRPTVTEFFTERRETFWEEELVMHELVRHVLDDMNKQCDRIIKSIDALDDELIWKKMKSHMNSIGNLCLHLVGNEYQNFISAIGNKPFIRERTHEFTTVGGIARDELIRLLLQTRSESASILASLSDEDVKREVVIRYGHADWNNMLRVDAAENETYEVREIGKLLVQVSAHYAYHAGQIVLLSKLLKDSTEHITGQYH